MCEELNCGPASSGGRKQFSPESGALRPGPHIPHFAEQTDSLNLKILLRPLPLSSPTAKSWLFSGIEPRLASSRPPGAPLEWGEKREVGVGMLIVWAAGTPLVTRCLPTQPVHAAPMPLTLPTHRENLRLPISILRRLLHFLTVKCLICTKFPRVFGNKRGL